jgi:hypothetical protein
MTDTITKERVAVHTFKNARPRIELSVAQLERLTNLLDARQIPYWVAEESLSWEGGPEMIWVTLERKTDAEVVQRLLDSVP